MKVSQLPGTPFLSFPRRRESSSIKTLDSRLRGNDGFFSFMAIYGDVL